MSDARQAILSKIRASLGRDRLSEAQLSELERRTQDQSGYIRPAFEEPPLLRFEDQLRAVAGSFERVPDRAAAFDALLAHLARHSLPPSLVAAPGLADWPWPQALSVRFGGTEGGDLVAVTGCFAAVAETGSVVLLSGPDSPTGLNFLPDYHVALVEAAQLVSHVEDVWPRLRQLPAMPRTINFISGPSKTADVEQTLQIGAHGPRSFHVIYIDKSA